MSNFHAPPITPKILKLVEQISEQVGIVNERTQLQRQLFLRRENKVRTIQASLEIEGNTLSLEQVTAVLDGKRIIAHRKDVQEIKNALDAYDRIDEWKWNSLDDLLEANNQLMKGLIEDCGHFRTGSAGVSRGEEVIHIAPPASMVPSLMKELIGFLENLDTSVLLKSCIFHYEFEYIHPFSDGNGRLGRLWQTLMLAQWRPLFLNLPVESSIRDHQAEYYDAFNRANKQTHSGIFVEFMLELIYETLLNTDDSVEPPGTASVTPSVTPPVEKLLLLLDNKGALSNQEILANFCLKDRRRMRESYISPAMESGLIEYTIPDKPNSSYQKYRLTRTGRDLLNSRRNS